MKAINFYALSIPEGALINISFCYPSTALFITYQCLYKSQIYRLNKLTQTPKIFLKYYLQKLPLFGQLPPPHHSKWKINIFFLLKGIFYPKNITYKLFITLLAMTFFLQKLIFLILQTQHEGNLQTSSWYEIKYQLKINLKVSTTNSVPSWLKASSFW